MFTRTNGLRSKVCALQGFKIAGAVEKLREQAQEQIRKTQDQMWKQEELKKLPRTGSEPKTAGKQA
jgi:hypothetical protein